jgi:Transposase DDE domain
MKTLFDDRVFDEDQRVTLLVGVVHLAVRHAARVLPAYSDPSSPKVFTQRQLLALLVLRRFLRATYRGVVEHLALMPELREALALKKLPHFTTLQKFDARCDVEALVNRILAHVARDLTGGSRHDGAMDSTGLETTSASAHFVARNGRKRGRFLKVCTVVLCGLFLPTSLHIEWGPRDDHSHAKRLAAAAHRATPLAMLWCDKGYDSEGFHEHCWDRLGVISYAPPRMRAGQEFAGGAKRALMQQRWTGYGDRWAVETFHSAMKRTLGSTLAARTDATMRHEAALMVLTYALRV